MDEKQKKALLDRILEYFETIAPDIVRESVQSLATDDPIIELYDQEFYLEKMSGAFDDVDVSMLNTVVSENIDLIDDIFFKIYKSARKPDSAD